MYLVFGVVYYTPVLERTTTIWSSLFFFTLFFGQLFRNKTVIIRTYSIHKDEGSCLFFLSFCLASFLLYKFCPHIIVRLRTQCAISYLLPPHQFSTTYFDLAKINETISALSTQHFTPFCRARANYSYRTVRNLCTAFIIK